MIHDVCSMELARKLRPEFEKIFVTSELNDALNMVTGNKMRNNSHVDLVNLLENLFSVFGL